MMRSSRVRVNLDNEEILAPLGAVAPWGGKRGRITAGRPMGCVFSFGFYSFLLRQAIRLKRAIAAGLPSQTECPRLLWVNRYV